MNKAGLLLAASLLAPLYMSGQATSDTVLINRLKINRSNFKELDNGPSLRLRVRAVNKDIDVSPVAFETPTRCVDCSVIDSTRHPQIIEAARISDLVAIGRVTRSISCLTENEGFVLSDAQFVIEDVLKADKLISAVPTLIGSEVTVSVAGGAVVVEGHHVHAEAPNVNNLQVGHKYLLFLKYLPDSQSFKPVGLDGFDLSNETVMPRRRSIPAPANELFKNKVSFLEAVHSSVESVSKVGQ